MVARIMDNHPIQIIVSSGTVILGLAAWLLELVQYGGVIVAILCGGMVSYWMYRKRRAEARLLEEQLRRLKDKG